ncbi:MAG: transporter [Colwellia sp.]|nr:transporter [Colwellia sp.]
MNKTTLASFAVMLIAGFNAQAHADIGSVAKQVEKEALAKQLSNPIAALISLPLQLNYDQNIGLNDQGERWTLNVQPVAPFELSKDWNVISRTILPIISQKNVSGVNNSESGIGDIVQSVFFSPKAPTKTGWIWGAGPVLLLPTGSDKMLTADKWGIGPTAVALKQKGPWTYGGLANHIISIAGDDDRGDINATFLQPFLSYTTPAAITYTLNAEATYDWEGEQWTIPVYAGISKVLKINSQLISVAAGVRYWAATTDSSPEGIALRVSLTFMFPK